MPKTIALFMDALSNQYISPETTPNLHRWTGSHGKAELAPLFAFQGVAVAMFTGAPPSATGIWTDFRVHPKPTRERPDPLALMLDKLPQGLPRKAALTLYERYLRGAYVTPHVAPARLRDFFEPALKTSLTSENPFPRFPTVFDIHREAGRKVFVQGLSGGPQQTLLKRMPSIPRRSEDLILYKINLLDHIGHAAGPDSLEIRKALAHMDRQLGEAVKNGQGNRLVIFSDHGMSAIEGSVDLRGLITREAPKYKEGRDYVAFFNSTCALFRWQNPDAREAVLSLVRAHPQLKVLGPRDYADLQVGDVFREYADDAVVTIPGIVISPDFYSGNLRAGMHGFATRDGACAVVVSPTDDLRAKGEMHDITPTLLEMSGIEAPPSCLGKSLLK